MGRQREELEKFRYHPTAALASPRAVPYNTSHDVAPCYEKDLQQAIEASLMDNAGASIDTTHSLQISLEPAELFAVLMENRAEEESQMLMQQYVPELGEEPISLTGANLFQEKIRIIDSIVAWGKPESKDYLTPICLKSVFSPMPIEVSEAYKTCLQQCQFKEVGATATSELLDVVFGKPAISVLKTGDMLRWLRHPLMFTNTAEMPWALVQFSGGPCGVLATLQSYIIRALFFDQPGMYENLASSDKLGAFKFFPSKNTLRRALAESVAFSIAQASSDKPYKLCWVVPKPMGRFESYLSLNDLSAVGTVQSYDSDIDEKTELLDSVRILVREFDTLSELTEFIYIHATILFSAPRVPGCLNLVLSLVMSRKPHILRIDDFEDELDRTLLGMFGQCNQELVNLMLIGRGTSNLFDGDRILGPDVAPSESESQEIIFLRGVPRRSTIGYLSEMEALRYCEVGDYLKFPYYPVWVCGSADHFTVVFSLNRDTAKISIAEYAMKIAEDAFRSVVGEEDEAGILEAKYLNQLLEAAGFQPNVGELQRRALAEVVQEDQVILMTEFVQWFVPMRFQSRHITEMSDVEKSRVESSAKPRDKFHLFHYDGQVRISEQLTVVTGPELKFLKLHLLGQGLEGSTDALSRILSTRWQPPIQLDKHSTEEVRKNLRRIIRAGM
eukprot:Gregarina_sp_Poly_1__2586@NODE_16_length_22882_cov_82_653956_g14_i0_p3_GENE_NODE_16_length_22882_cov_82_653956_g14_i0NODE_16_length_22882_cov_82_653956_g14_i0_p3_ORF_typecomplete_len672_score96_33DUF4205/PF13898_6/9_1e59ADSL_C/PF10397_9/0_35UIM/PF02809_20/1_2UIM/PF02809_20/4_3e02_NODE_16_length_22882_cov_82_653956_g14_i025544569